GVATRLVRQRAAGRADLPPALTALGLSAWMTQSSLERLSQICEDVKETLDRATFASLDRKTAVLGVFSILRGA
ncbi:MAG TPA: hypothetical protein PKX87_01080, partial [Alphaproteobacteria bacterium]|nr:hypothetical protein [Alphaproteobacteria bacterium]